MYVFIWLRKGSEYHKKTYSLDYLWFTARSLHSFQRNCLTFPFHKSWQSMTSSLLETSSASSRPSYPAKGRLQRMVLPLKVPFTTKEVTKLKVFFGLKNSIKNWMSTNKKAVFWNFDWYALTFREKNSFNFGTYYYYKIEYDLTFFRLNKKEMINHGDHFSNSLCNLSPKGH